MRFGRLQQGIGVPLGALLAAALCVLISVASGPPQQLALNGGPAAGSPDFDRLPLAFEPAAGRTGGRYDFTSSGDGWNLGLAADSAVIEFEAGKDRLNSIELQLLGADPRRNPAPLERLPGVVNRYAGEPSQWRTGIPTFGRVRYEQVWPGVDVEWYGRGGKLEYDFVLAPNANPDSIAFRVAADSVGLARNGDLLIEAGARRIRQHAPIAFQEINGARRLVESGYVVEGRTVSFELGAYNPTVPLVIDPSLLAYSSFLGGSGGDEARDIEVAADGSVIVVGTTSSIDFPHVGEFDNDPTNSFDAFVSKLSPAGNSLVYSTYLGGDGVEEGLASDLNPATGEVAVVGSTEYAGGSPVQTFPTTPNAFQTAGPGNADRHAFVSKLSSGGTLSYSTFLGSAGGTDSDSAYGVTFGASGTATAGHLIVVGGTDSVNFPVAGAVAAADSTHNDLEDVFLARLDPSQMGAAQLGYSTYLGSAGLDRGTAVDVDSSGVAYLSGQSTGAYPATTNAFDTTHSGSNFDAIVSRVNTTTAGAAGHLYSSFLSGVSGFDTGYDIVARDNGSAFVTGHTTAPGTEWPTTPGAFQTSNQGNFEVFLTQLDMNNPGSGAADLLNSTLLGGSTGDNAWALAIDSAGVAHIAGDTLSADFPTPGGFDTTGSINNDTDSFVASLVPSGTGTQLRMASFLGGSASEEHADGIALDAGGNLFVSGGTFSSDFPTTTGALDDSYGGFGDAFVARICGGSATIDGSPMNATVDCLGRVQANFDGDSFNRFDSYAGGPAAGLSIDFDTGATYGVFGPVQFAPVTPPVVSGGGTTITTVYRAFLADAAQLTITQVDQYTPGENGFTTSYTLENTGTSPVGYRSFVAGDLMPAGDDFGVGRTDLGSPRFISSLSDPYQTGDGLSETSPWSHFQADDIATIASTISAGGTNLSNTINPSRHDLAVAVERNGHAGSEFPLNPLNDGASETFSVRWDFKRVPPPVYKEKVVVRPTGGTCLVQAPGQPDFFQLPDARRIPIGSLIDVRNCFIELTAKRCDGTEDTATFWAGLFQINEVGECADSVHEAKLVEPLTCAGAKSKKRKRKRKGRAAAARGPLARAAATSRRLWTKGKGRFRTTGYRGSATIRGTEWETVDRCARQKRKRIILTSFQSVEGLLEIDVFGKKGTINKILGPGKPFVAGKKVKKKKKKKKK